MPWKFPEVRYVEYSRNPLISVDIELRYFPVTSITDDPSVFSRIQGGLRSEFPDYHTNNVRDVALSPSGEFEVNTNEKQFVLKSKGKGRDLILGPRSLRLSVREHKNKSETIGHLLWALGVVEKVVGELEFLRIGVRYVNLVDKDQIAKDLGVESLDWSEVVNSKYFSAPREYFDLCEARFVNQVWDSVESGGGASLRYGLGPKNQEETDTVFRFDVDRFVDSIEGGENLNTILDQFSLEIYSLFHDIVGEKLKLWMEGV